MRQFVSNGICSDQNSKPNVIFPPIDTHALNLDLPFQDIQLGVLPDHTIPLDLGLENKPQDPIIEALKRRDRYGLVSFRHRAGEEEGAKNALSVPSPVEEVGKDDNWPRGIWTSPEVIAPPKKCIHTWDDFQQPNQPRLSPFLSEQPTNVFDAVRYHVNFKLKDPTNHFRYILPDELWTNLQLNLLGNSSGLFIWENVLERLVPKTVVTGEEKIQVTLEGVGSDVFTSVFKVFLDIGTNIRRVDEFISRLRQRPESPPIYASFLHSLTSVISYLQSILSSPSPFEIRQLVGISTWYRPYDQILSSMVSLCRCDGEPPFSFPINTSHDLLDHIFGELQNLLIIKAPREVIATLAYVLTTTSETYLRRLSSSIGLLYETSRTSSNNPSIPTLTDQFDNQSSFIEPVPSFFPKSLAASLPAAQKSLSILKSAGLPCQAWTDTPCMWVWTAEELEERWLHDRKGQRELLQDAPTLPLGSKHPPSPHKIETESINHDLFSQFALFDLDPPGSHLRTNNLDANSTSAFSNFLMTFPEDLPLVAPTLSHLAQMVLRPLSIRTAVLSNLSLRLFLDSLHFDIHLRILKSYFFMTASSSFKRRLVTALLYDESSESALALGATGANGVAIGLVAGLSSSRAKIQPRTWPPKGSELSFSLRNVIVNSLEEDFDYVGASSEHQNRGLRDVVTDAEQRLGFGLRDLPIEDGNARWLNPMSIEALDFLYLDYKTSQPLDVVITPQTITKYQRMFTFLLRLMRAEVVMRITYKNIYSSSTSLLPYAGSNARFIARSLYFQLATFLSSLSAYIYDSVIGGVFDKYLAQVEQIREELQKDEEKESIREDNPNSNSNSIDLLHSMNIFLLGESHSRLLDRILRCCFLVSGGRGTKRAGNVLRDLLDLILRFGTLFLDMRRGTVKDFEVEERLIELNEEFRRGMVDFITAIRNLQETQTQMQTRNMDDITDLPSRRRGRDRFNNDFATPVSANDSVQAQTRAQDLDQIYLDELLTRLDPCYWWRRQTKEGERGG